MATPLPENRARFTAGEIAAATGGALVDVAADRVLEGVGTDTRRLRPGSLFVALAGAHHDGHRFAAAASEAGALPLVEPGRDLALPRIETPDTLVALGRLARAFFARETATRPVPSLAIGGAAGKTTTKTLAAAAARALFGEILVPEGNLNNRIGVPLTLLALEPRHRAVVVEFGTSEPGEIDALSAIVEPEVGLVLNVGIEHSEFLGGLEAIADEEGALLLAARRIAVTSADEPLLLERLARAGASRRTFGWSAGADLRLLARAPLPAGGGRLQLGVGGAYAAEACEVDAETRLLGPAVASNFAGALAAALSLLPRPATASELADALAALAEVAAAPGRLRPVPGARGELLIDDSYNSNPRSAAASLEAARETAASRKARLVLVLGDMLELGPLAPEAHDALLESADALAPGQLVLIGEQLAGALARRAPRSPCSHFHEATAAAEAAPTLVAPQDVVLIKGSRGIRTDRVVAALAADGARLPAL